MNPKFLLPAYLVIVLLPLALAWLGARPARGLWDELASGAGMLAFAIILVEFVLSGRFRSVSRRIGMDVTMRFHQLLARTALGLALLHPFLYQAPFNPPMVWDATRQFTITVDLASLATGIVAWLLLPTFILLSIARSYLAYSYEAWRLMHGLGALLIAALLLHHTLAAGRYSQDPVLLALWLILFGIALLTLIHIYLMNPIRKWRNPWRVERVKPIAERTWEVTVVPDGHDGLAFEAGQFAWLNIGHRAISVHENPFSISSAPDEGRRVQFMIKELGDFTRRLGSIAPGTKAYLDAPHGNLVISGRREPGIALWAGGVGLAPLLSILRQLRSEADVRPVALVYGNRLDSQIAYRQELAELGAREGNRLHLVLSEPDDGWRGHVGLIDANLVREIFEPRMTDWLHILCGPDAMMATVEDTLIALGVPPRQILSERFKHD